MRNYQDKQYKLWRQEIYKRDNHTCQWPGCSYNGKYINAHHIKKWSDYPGLRFHTMNGITLCKNHHNMIKDMETDYESFFLKIVAQKNAIR